MILIQVLATKQSKAKVLKWIVKRIYSVGFVQLLDLRLNFRKEITLVDNDDIYYWAVGWNYNDLPRLIKSIKDTDDIEIPRPRNILW